MKRIAVLILLIWQVTANAGDYATCILDKMPGSVNEAFTGSVYSQCSSEYPSTLYDVKKGSGRGIFGFKDGNACIQSKAKNTPNPRAALMIANACRCLYIEAIFDGEMCAYRPLPN